MREPKMRQASRKPLVDVRILMLYLSFGDDGRVVENANSEFA